MIVRFQSMVLALCVLAALVVASPLSAKEFKAPEFELPTLAGERLALEQFRNENPVLLVFWATWCPGCIKEIPNINDLVAKYQSQGLVTIGVNIGEPPGRVERFKKKYEPRYPLALDKGNQVSKKYQIRGVPTMMVINKHGNITYASYSITDRLHRAVEVALEG